MSLKTHKVLRRMGLTKYEAEAYLLLLNKGPLTARQISLGAQIPYSKVYEVLSSLEKKGWIDVQGKRPSRYLPKSPEIALKNVRSSFESEWSQWERIIIDELAPLYEKLKIREKYDIWIIKGAMQIFSKFKEMIKGCSQEMLIAFPYISEELLMDFYQLVQLLAGKIRLCFMVCKGINENVYKILSNIGEVKLRDKMFGGGAISDSREVLLLFSDEKGDVTAIWSDHPGLAGLAKDYFNYLWRESVA